MLAVKRACRMPEPCSTIKLYADLSKAKMVHRRHLTTIIKVLQNHKIVCKWGFPTKLTVTHQGKSHTIYTLAAGLHLLKTWHIIPEEEPVPTPPSTSYMETEWATQDTCRYSSLPLHFQTHQ